MIRSENLSKSYGPARALKEVSFEVARGEVVGFLGPNGAGKSTTMKILTGYLLPSGGQASVDGFDVVKDSLEVRRRIGYLPESTPLYTEMRVDDYLRFAAEIRGVPGGQLRKAIHRVVDLCGLERVTGKNIIELSKGYKQRVGLAQAMVHEPDLLILDEPTSGLDPNQINEVRQLIRRLGEEHTVLLSTHYLQEVEAVCSRIIVLNLGEIVADGTRDSLIAEMPAGPVIARIKGAQEAVLGQMGELFPGRHVTHHSLSEGYVEYSIDAGANNQTAVQEAVAHLVTKNEWSLAELRRESASLEQVFRSLTLGEGADSAVQSRAGAAEDAGEADGSSEVADGGDAEVLDA